MPGLLLVFLSAAIVWYSAAYIWYRSKIRSPVISKAFYSTMDKNLSTSFFDCDRYTPSVEDVIATKEALFKKFKLPIELIDTIIDFAEYHPCTTMCRTGGELHVRSGGSNEGESTEDRFILRSLPLGYVTDKSFTNTCSMGGNNRSYPVIPAKPWKDSDSLPADITEDIKKQWAAKSLMRGESPCRKIVFTIASHDQGWGGASEHKGTFKGSFTWFDVGKEKVHLSTVSKVVPGTDAFPTLLLEHGSTSRKDNRPMACTVETVLPTVSSDSPDRFEHPLLPTLDCLQKNRTAKKKAEEYKIVWNCDDKVDPDSLDGKTLEEQGRGRNTANGQFVRDMRVGDIVTVWGKARFPGWVNMVEKVQIDVYWAV